MGRTDLNCRENSSIRAVRRMLDATPQSHKSGYRSVQQRINLEKYKSAPLQKVLVILFMKTLVLFVQKVYTISM